MAETWSDTQKRVRGAIDVWGARGCLVALYQNGLCRCGAAVKEGGFVKGGQVETGSCVGQFNFYPDDDLDVNLGGGEG